MSEKVREEVLKAKQSASLALISLELEVGQADLEQHLNMMLDAAFKAVEINEKEKAR